MAEFHAHLQTLCGTDVNTGANPVVFTAGLPSLCSMWVSLIRRGGADVLMCSTACVRRPRIPPSLRPSL